MTCIYATGQACDAQHAARYIGWTSFNPRLRGGRRVSQITQGSVSLGFEYGAEHQRMKMCKPDCTNPTSTTYYLFEPFSGSIGEKVVAGGATTWRDYIVNPDGQLVAERFDNGTVSWRYFVTDHLVHLVREHGCCSLCLRTSGS